METLADACDKRIRQLSQANADQAVKLAGRFVKHAARRRGVLLKTALRSQAWAELVRGNHRQAEQSYLQAREMVQRHPDSRARIDRILIDVYMYLGDYKEAQRRARMAMTTFRRLKADEELAKTEVNYANLLHRQDRHREARELYASAASFFKKQGNRLAQAICNYNLANTLVQLFQFDKAMQLYEQTRQTFTEFGFDLYVIDSRNGLAWLHMLNGDYQVALEELAACEAGYRRVSKPRGIVLCKLDSAEAYLGLNLFADARIAAREARKLAHKLGIRYESAKADFFFAKASFAMGKQRDARKALAQAKNGFVECRSAGFLVAANLLSVQMGSGRARDKAIIKEVRESFSQSQLPLWEAICDLETLSYDSNGAGILRRLAKNPAVRTVPHLLARYQTVLGDRSASGGHQQDAIQHWTRAAEVLDAVRAKLPPVDLRTAFTRHRTDPYLKLIENHSPENPSVAAAWSERYKTAGLWGTPDAALASHPARKKAEQSLAELAGRYATLSSRIEKPSSTRLQLTAPTDKYIAELQRRTRRHLASLEKPGEDRIDSIENIVRLSKKLSHQYPIVQFHVGRGELRAFVHYRGDIHHYRYPDGAVAARKYAAEWRLLLGQRLFDFSNGHRQQIDEESRLFTRIGDWLWSPLEIAATCRKVLILPEGALANLPWPALKTAGRPLIDRHEIHLSPSLRHHSKAASTRVRSSLIKIFVGSTGSLTRAADEIAALRRLSRNKQQSCDPCFRRHIPNGESARLWHYTGHAQLRADNPFYSALMLADGPLFAADFRLRSNRVGLVMLAGCRTGQQVSLPGEESTGLVRSLLEMGARGVIASHWPVADEPTSKWITYFYREYFNGQPAARAVRRASIKLRKQYPSAFHWAAFSLFGAD